MNYSVHPSFEFNRWLKLINLYKNRVTFFLEGYCRSNLFSRSFSKISILFVFIIVSVLCLLFRIQFCFLTLFQYLCWISLLTQNIILSKTISGLAGVWSQPKASRRERMHFRADITCKVVNQAEVILTPRNEPN